MGTRLTYGVETNVEGDTIENAEQLDEQWDEQFAEMLSVEDPDTYDW